MPDVVVGKHDSDTYSDIHRDNDLDGGILKYVACDTATLSTAEGIEFGCALAADCECSTLDAHVTSVVIVGTGNIVTIGDKSIETL